MLRSPRNKNATPPAPPPSSDAAKFLKSLQDTEIIERVRCTIKNAHVFKLPPRQSATVGWRGADWKEKVWQGTVKVVERDDLTAVLLVDRTKGSIFAVCPAKEGAVDRCVDSSRYFVLRIENANGRHMFIGVAFNERNDAFDFNTALEDARREKEMENNPIKLTGPSKDYSLKEGDKIKVTIPRAPYATGGGVKRNKPPKGNSARFLRPSNKDTPSRTEVDGVIAAKPVSPVSAVTEASEGCLDTFFSDAGFNDPFPSSTFDGNNFFRGGVDDQSTGTNPFFKSDGKGEDTYDTSNPRYPMDRSEDQFDPNSFQTESGR
mmetsp:Transcript_7954/g.11428  ORF Transcript_7954/g.11428 Transcript_7954/m.11428 type:complete len:319 (-) Transcript_7954:1867-2823(-)